jgi:hypothetical protein
MDTIAWIVVAGIAVVAVALIWYLVRSARTRALQQQFGSEYDRTVSGTDGRRAAEAELRARQDRVDELDLTPLSRSDHDRFASEWTKVQAEFVDDPVEAVSDADHLIQTVMQRRGYPMEDFDRRAADLSVAHPDVVENYRSAHSIAVKETGDDAETTNTEALRKAMVYYRSLFDELLVVDDGDDRRN